MLVTVFRPLIKEINHDRALGARKTLTPRFTDFFTDFEKKTDCFAVYYFPTIFHITKSGLSLNNKEILSGEHVKL